MTQMTFYFCPECGQYCKHDPPGRSFVRVPQPVCPDCGVPIQLTGLAIWLVGVLVSFPLSLVLGLHPTDLACAIFSACTIIGIMRSVRQYRAWRRHSARQRRDLAGRTGIETQR